MNEIITKKTENLLKNKVNLYLQLPYKIKVQALSDKDGGGFFANYEDFPFIIGDGETELDAINDVKKAFAFVIEQDLKEGKFIKLPSQKNYDLNDYKKVNISISISQNLDLPKNYFQNKHNIYGNTASFNMLCIPRSKGNINIQGMPKITDANYHPLRR